MPHTEVDKQYIDIIWRSSHKVRLIIYPLVENGKIIQQQNGDYELIMDEINIMLIWQRRTNRYTRRNPQKKKKNVAVFGDQQTKELLNVVMILYQTVIHM